MFTPLLKLTGYASQTAFAQMCAKAIFQNYYLTVNQLLELVPSTELTLFLYTSLTWLVSLILMQNKKKIRACNMLTHHFLLSKETAKLFGGMGTRCARIRFLLYPRQRRSSSQSVLWPGLRTRLGLDTGHFAEPVQQRGTIRSSRPAGRFTKECGITQLASLQTSAEQNGGIKVSLNALASNLQFSITRCRLQRLFASWIRAVWCSDVCSSKSLQTSGIHWHSRSCLPTMHHGLGTEDRVIFNPPQWRQWMWPWFNTGSYFLRTELRSVQERS